MLTGELGAVGSRLVLVDLGFNHSLRPGEGPGSTSGQQIVRSLNSGVLLGHAPGTMGYYYYY